MPFSVSGYDFTATIVAYIGICYDEIHVVRHYHWRGRQMTEKDKMLAGKAYLAGEEQLVKERQYAKQVLFKFNNMNPVLVEARNNLLRELLGQTKENFYFEPPFRCDYGYNIEIGNNFYSNYNLTILDCAKVKIGDNVFIARMLAYLQLVTRFIMSLVIKNMNMLYQLRSEIMFGLVGIQLLIQVLKLGITVSLVQEMYLLQRYSS